MIERVGLEFAERQRLEGNFAEFAKSSYKGCYTHAKDITKDLNQCLEKIGWVCALYKTPFKLLGPKGVQSVESMLIFAPQSILQEDLVNTAKLERAHGIYVCLANLDDDNGHIWLITCGAQNLKEAQNTPAFPKLFKKKNDKHYAKYHLDHFDNPRCFLRLVALFDDLPLQDFKVGGVGSRQTFPRESDVYFLKAFQICNGDAYGRRDSQQAIEHYQKSAELGDVESFYEIGAIYVMRAPSNNIFPNFTKALEYYEKAGEMGDTRSYEMLGHFYTNGKGVAVDTNKGLEYYHKAIDIGSTNACLELAGLYLRGIHVPKDPDIAQAYYNKAIKMGKTKLEKAHICAEVAREYSAYIEDIYPRGACRNADRQKAVAYYQKAAILAKEVFGAEAYHHMVYWGEYYLSDTQCLK
uniref:tetratricopeptide repeat protein n=1 Tax=Helicobacter bizzozeronii TaxID=56877 RepID=UPI001F417DC3